MKKTYAFMMALLGAWSVVATAADQFPDKPVRFIVPFPAGGGTDAFARVLGGKLTELWGQQVLIDNRGGAQARDGGKVGREPGADRADCRHAIPRILRNGSTS